MLKPISEFKYDSQLRSLIHLPTGDSYSDYLGVGKVSNYRKPNIMKELAKVHGKEKAARIQENSISRGNRIHKKVEKPEFDPYPELGVATCEVFVFGKLRSDLRAVQGCLDRVYEDKQGDYHIIEFKTKSNPYKWRKVKQNVIETYFTQLAAYERLFEITYGVKPKSCTLSIVFANDDYYPDTIKMQRGSLDHYYQQFMKNLEAMSKFNFS